MTVLEPSYYGQTQEWLPDGGTSTCASRRSPPSVRTLAWLPWDRPIEETGILVIRVTHVSASCSDQTAVPDHVLAIQVKRH